MLFVEPPMNRLAAVGPSLEDVLQQLSAVAPELRLCTHPTEPIHDRVLLHRVRKAQAVEKVFFLSGVDAAQVGDEL